MCYPLDKSIQINRENIIKFNLGDYKLISTPHEMDINKIGEEVEFIDYRFYREIIGSLIYISWVQRGQIFVMQFQDYLRI